MTAPPETPQRLPQLASLPEARACVDALVHPVAPREVELAAAAGRVLAADVAVGAPLRAIDLAVRRAAGVPRVMVRQPKLRLVTANPTIDAIDDTVAPFIARAIDLWGGVAEIVRVAPGGALDQLLRVGDADAIVVIGGTGSGRHDASVRTLARLGRVDLHGVALVPGETIALGAIDTRPVLVVPGRLD